MIPAIDSVTRTLVEGAQYAPRDPAHFWSVLYPMGANWSYDDPLCEIGGDRIRMPRMVMQEYATAAFLDYDDLLPRPEDSSIVCDADWDAYWLPLSDMGDTGVVLVEVVDTEPVLCIAVELRDVDDVALAAADVMLADNPYAARSPCRPSFSQLRYDLYDTYRDDTVRMFDDARYHWISISYFYTACYVYQYGTSVSYAASLYQAITSGQKGALVANKGFRKLGGSMAPADLLKAAGIGPLSEESYRLALAYYADLVDQYEALVDERVQTVENAA